MIFFFYCMSNNNNLLDNKNIREIPKCVQNLFISLPEQTIRLGLILPGFVSGFTGGGVGGISGKRKYFGSGKVDS